MLISFKNTTTFPVEPKSRTTGEPTRRTKSIIFVFRYANVCYLLFVTDECMKIFTEFPRNFRSHLLEFFLFVSDHLSVLNGFWNQEKRKEKEEKQKIEIIFGCFRFLISSRRVGLNCSFDSNIWMTSSKFLIFISFYLLSFRRIIRFAAVSWLRNGFILVKMKEMS